MSQFWFINLIMDYVSLPLCIPANLWLGVIVNFKLLTLYSGLRLFENCLMLWVLVLTGEVLRLGLITPHHRGKAFLGLYLMPWELRAFPIWLVVSDSFQPQVNTRHCFLSSFWVVLSLALDGFPIEHLLYHSCTWYSRWASTHLWSSLHNSFLSGTLFWILATLRASAGLPFITPSPCHGLENLKIVSGAAGGVHCACFHLSEITVLCYLIFSVSKTILSCGFLVGFFVLFWFFR